MNNLSKKALEIEPSKIIELVTQLGADRYVEKEDYIIFPTICHNKNSQEASMKLYYYKNNCKFMCYTQCGCSFNIYGLFQRHYEAIGYKYDFFSDIVLPIFGDKIYENEYNNLRYESDYSKYNKTKITINRTSLNPNILNIYSFNPTLEWLNDGISKEIMRKYNILYSIDENKIIIPHYDENGNLIGVRARSLNDEDIEFGKYMPVMVEGKILAHQLGYNLYGLNLVKDNIKNKKMAIVAEGEKSVLQYATMFGQENNICVATCGSSFSRYQFELLYKIGVNKILIAFDNDEKVWKEKEKYYKKLEALCGRYKNLCKIGFIWDTQNLLDLKDSPFDKGKEVFLELYKGAKWI